MSKHSRKRGAFAPRAHDACVDADVYFSDRNPAHQRKAEQLRAAIHRTLSAALACDVDDPALADLDVVDVIADPTGTFAALFATAELERIDAVQARLRDALPIFRRALAEGLARKRIPQLALFVVPRHEMEGGDAQ